MMNIVSIKEELQKLSEYKQKLLTETKQTHEKMIYLSGQLSILEEQSKDDNKGN